MAWWGVLSKNEIRDFWDVRVGKAYKCPQMNTMKFLVHESFGFGGVCTWPKLAVHNGIGGVVGSFVTKWNSLFLRCEGWKGLQMSPNEYHEILGARKFWVRKGLHTASLSVYHGIAWLLGGEFSDEMKFVLFEMWGLERPTNIPKWIPWNSWCTKVLGSEGFAHGQSWRCTMT